MFYYMDYLVRCFYKATDWNLDNIYPNLCETPRSILQFKVPSGVSLEVASQASEHSASSYTLSNRGFVRGSLAYLYSSTPLKNVSTSKEINLKDAIASYRVLDNPRLPQEPRFKEIWLAGKRVDAADSLLYGRLYLPENTLEALAIRRISPTAQILVTAASDHRYRNQGSMTFYLQRDLGKYAHEYIFSTNEALVGFRGVYNFGFDEKVRGSAQDQSDKSQVTVGGEVYLGLLNKSPGLSTAVRYTTESAYTSKPLTMTLACNPLIGFVSMTYNVHTSSASSFCSKYDFNFYSYESDLSVGTEIWRNGNQFVSDDELLQYQQRLNQPVDETQGTTVKPVSSPFTNVIKTSTSITNKTLNLLWEGRFKEFLVSAGACIHLRDRLPVVPKIGIEFQYSS